MSYFNKQQSAQQATKKPLAATKKEFQKRPDLKQQEPREEPQEKLLGFAQDEVIFIENVLVKLQTMIPNEQGENSEILEMLVTAQQIVSARLDQESGMIGDSA